MDAQTVTMTPLRALALAAILLTPAALAAPTPLPTLTLDAAPIGRTAKVEQVESVPQPEGPVMTFPAHTRAVLNAPEQPWKAGYAGEEPPAYVAVIPLDTLKTHYPAVMGLGTEVDRAVAMARGRQLFFAVHSHPQHGANGDRFGGPYQQRRHSGVPVSGRSFTGLGSAGTAHGGSLRLLRCDP
ncbi:hypothetical protein ACFP81_08805 [Deinococcus lacus]|uniref:Uncharacterized protein n=1 Tax=Deinococcus lacus TaxID=392561 RepID=A0ABW1YES2_9DEIO